MNGGVAGGADVNPEAQCLAGLAAASAVDFMSGCVSKAVAVITTERFMYEQ